jgi:tetratricopeptide (TPR) repeat protein
MINKINFKEMKKKSLMFFFGFIAAISTVMGQAQNPECMTNLSIFSEHAKVKNYDAAFEPWKMVRDNCPELHLAIYVYGERILKDKIEKSEGGDKTGYINMLSSMYDDSNKYFPKKFSLAGVAADKAILMYDEKMGTDDELYKMLNEAYEKDRANFSNPKALYLYFSVLVDLHNADKKDLQEVFDTYDNVTEKIDEEKAKLANIINSYLEKEEAGTLTAKEKRKLKNARINSASYDKISGSIDAKLGNLADCDKLIPLYKKNFENKKTDAVWLKRAAGRMDQKECTDDPMFVTMVEALHQLDPSADSAYYLGLLNDKAGKSSEAIKYYNEAVELQTDSYKKAKILYKIATKFKTRGQKSSARNYAQKALNYQPSMGAAYLLIANLYADSANECGTTTFEKRAIYWKAADMARKAGRVDSSISGSASRAATSYEQRAPSKQDIFTSGMAGKTITFNCWVGGSVKVPSL